MRLLSHTILLSLSAHPLSDDNHTSQPLLLYRYTRRSLSIDTDTIDRVDRVGCVGVVRVVRLTPF